MSVPLTPNSSANHLLSQLSLLKSRISGYEQPFPQNETSNLRMSHLRPSVNKKIRFENTGLPEVSQQSHQPFPENSSFHHSALRTNFSTDSSFGGNARFSENKVAERANESRAQESFIDIQNQAKQVSVENMSLSFLNSDLHSEIDSLRKEKTRLAAQLSVSQAELTSAQNSSLHLTNKLNELKEALNMQKQVNSSLDNSKATLQHTVSEMQTELKELKVQFKLKSEQYDILFKQSVDVEELRAKLSTVENELQAQKAAEASLKEDLELKIKDNARLHEELATEATAKDELAREIGRLDTAVRAEQAKTQAEETHSQTLAQELERFQDRLRILQEQLAESQQTHSALSESALRDRAALAHAQDRCDRLENQLQESQATHTHLEQELQSAVEAIDEADQKLSQYSAQCHHCNTHHTFLQEEVDNLLHRVEELTTANVQLEDERKNHAATLVLKADETQARVQECETLIADLRKELSDVKEKCQELERQEKTATEAKAKADLELTFLRDDCQEEIFQYRGTISHLRTTNQTLKEALSSTQKELEESRKKRESDEKAVPELQRTLDKALMDLAHANARGEQWGENEKTLREELAALRSQACPVCETLRTQVQSQTEQLCALNAKNASLEEKLGHADRTRESLGHTVEQERSNSLQLLHEKEEQTRKLVAAEAELKYTLKELREKTSEVETVKQQRTATQARVAELELELKNLQKTLSSHRRQSSRQDQARERLAGVSALVSRLENQLITSLAASSPVATNSASQKPLSSSSLATATAPLTFDSTSRRKPRTPSRPRPQSLPADTNTHPHPSSSPHSHSRTLASQRRTVTPTPNPARPRLSHSQL